jgi:hypothetical protein
MNMQYSPGRPHLLTEEQEQLFYQTVVEKTPADVGFPENMNWTSPLAKDWIERHFFRTQCARTHAPIGFKLYQANLHIG